MHSNRRRAATGVPPEGVFSTAESEIEITVSDTGQELASERLDRVSEASYTTKSDGTVDLPLDS